MDWVPTKTADSWMFSHSEGIDLLITQMMPSSRGLHAWVEMRWRGNVPSPGLITAARYDLMGSRTVGSMVARIKDAGIDEKEPDWRHLIQSAVYDVIRDYLDGPEVVDLSKATPTTVGFILRPLIGDVGATSLVGAGKTGKSLLALACGCSIASGDPEWAGMKVIRPGPVIYADWEADAGTHAQRLNALSEGIGKAMPEGRLHYIQAEAPLTMWAPALARRIARLEGVLVIIDSVMMARGGEASAQDTIPFFLALRTLGVPSLLIDHQSREAIEKGKTGAFGSVVNDNTVRLRWLIRGTRGMVRLNSVAANNFGDLPTISLQLDRQTRGDMLRKARWVHVDAAPPAGSLTEGVLEYTRDHPTGLSPQTTAEALDSDPNTIRRLYHRLAERELVQQLDGEWFPSDEFMP